MVRIQLASLRRESSLRKQSNAGTAIIAHVNNVMRMFMFLSLPRLQRFPSRGGCRNRNSVLPCVQE